MIKYIYLRNAKSGGAQKYAEVLVSEVRKSNEVFYVETAQGVFNNEGRLVKKYSVIILFRSIERYFYLLRIVPVKVLIPYQVIPFEMFFLSSKVSIMIRNMEPFLSKGKYNFKNRFRNAIIKRWTLLSCYKADDIVCVARHVRDYFVSLNIISESKIRIVPHGLTLLEVDSKRVTDLSEYSFNEQNFILSVGSGLPYRGLEDLLNIAKNIPWVDFVWAGSFMDSQYEKFINTCLRENKVNNVYFIGLVTRKEVLNLMKVSSLYLATSRVEACPNTAIEASQMRCKIVATEIAAHREFLNGAAAFYPPENVLVAKDLILQALSSHRNTLEPVKLGSMSDSVKEFIK